MLYTNCYDSPVGELLLASDGENLTGLWMTGQKYFLGKDKETLQITKDLPIFNETKQWLAAYFSKEQPEISALKLAPSGGTFRQMVWKILQEIPYGEVTTYGEIAKKIAAELGKESMSSQAVGGAVGHNPISIIIPCHRVIGAKGQLTGYAGGLSRKQQLLSLEGVIL